MSVLFRVSRFVVRVCPGPSHQFAPRNVVANKIDQRAGGAGENFLEGFEYQGINQHVVDGGEVGAQRHVINVGIGFGGAQGGVDQFAVVAGQRDVPGFEFFLQRAELAAGQLVTKAARAAVGQEGDVVVLQAEGLGHAARTITIGDLHNFAFAKVVAAAVGAELADLVGKVVAHGRGVQQAVQAIFQRIARIVVAQVEGIFAMRCPMFRDAQGGADFGRGALRRRHLADLCVYMPALLHRALALAGTGGGARDDGIDQCAACAHIINRIRRHIQLQQTHRTFDIHPHRPRINMRRRNQHAPNRRTIPTMRIRVKHQIGHARSFARVERLRNTHRIKRIANRRGADDGDRRLIRLPRRQNGRGFAGGNEWRYCRFSGGHKFS